VSESPRVRKGSLILEIVICQALLGWRTVTMQDDK
jgi:heme A synthase